MALDQHTRLSPAEIRAARARSTARPRDLADQIGVAEAELLIAQTGAGDGPRVTRIAAHPDRLIPALAALGQVMALTRNDSAVIEKVGVFGKYSPGVHAGLVINGALDLRIFPSHWVHGFAVEDGEKRSIQVFDAAGDAVHKIHLRAESNHDAFGPLVAALACDEAPALTPRTPPEAPRVNPDRAAELREKWDAMTDTHQFLAMTSRLKLNRLGAYRIAGAPYARRLNNGAVPALLHRAAEIAVPIMVFVGNQGMIEIHTGPVQTIKEMGPWVNVIDPGFDLHLRMDHIAETWAVTKPTRRGEARSVECFDARGALIAQIFGVLKQPETVGSWNDLVAGLA